MPRLLFFENGAAPSTRSRRELDALRSAGWGITVVARTPVDGPWESAVVEHEWSHPIGDPLRERYLEAGKRRDERKREAAAGDPELEALGSVTRVLSAAHTIRTPIARSEPFGDLLRLHDFWIKAATAIAALPWDVAHAADLDALPGLVWATRGRGANERPIVYDAHELYPELSYLSEVYRRAWDDLARTFVPYADEVIAVSEEMATVLRDRYGARRVTVVQSHPVKGSTSRRLRAELGIAPGRVLAVHIGQVSENRRPERAITALAQDQDLHVAFVGPIAERERERISGAAIEAGVVERLHIVPPVPADEVPAYVSDADLSVVLYDGADNEHLRVTLPNKLYDALGAGLPVVAGAGTAVADAVTAGGYGLVFDPADEGSLAKAIAAVAGSPAYRERAAALAPAIDWGTQAPVYVAAVERALARPA